MKILPQLWRIKIRRLFESKKSKVKQVLGKKNLRHLLNGERPKLLGHLTNLTKNYLGTTNLKTLKILRKGKKKLIDKRKLF